MKLNSLLLVGALIGIGGVSLPAWCDAGVAQVTAVKGTVQVIEKGAAQPCKMFSSVQSGDTVDVSAGAQVTLFILGDKHREQIDGPAKFTVTAAGAQLPAGKKVVTQAPAALRVAGGSLAALNSDQYGGSVKRGGGESSPLRLVSAHQTATLTPHLHWTAVDGAASYKVELSPDLGVPPVFSQVVKSTDASVSSALKAGSTYYCTVTALDGDETAVGKVQEQMEILPANRVSAMDAARKQFESARGSGDASVYLEMTAAYVDAGMLWEASEVMQGLVQLSPTSRYPHERLASMYTAMGLTDKAEEETKAAASL